MAAGDAPENSPQGSGDGERPSGAAPAGPSRGPSDRPISGQTPRKWIWRRQYRIARQVRESRRLWAPVERSRFTTSANSLAS